MKLLSIEKTRLTDLFQVARPQGRLPITKIATELVDRYSFAGTPQSLDDLTSDHVEFSHGIFQDEAIEKLDVYNDGVVISGSSNSDFLEAFLDDIVLWLEQDLEMTRVHMKDVTRYYESEIVVELDPCVLDVLKPLNDICSKVSTMVKNNTGLEADYSALGYALTTEPASANGIVPSTFRVERRLASEFHFNQFVSTAPLKTDQHLDILRSIEDAARQNSGKARQ